MQLHIFCDAFEAAFGCVAYIRFSYKGGGHSCSFVMSKSRLAPIKSVKKTPVVTTKSSPVPTIKLSRTPTKKNKTQD